MSGCYAKQSYETFDLKPWQAGILIVLSMEGELSQRELAKKLNQTPPSVTTAIQKMEKLGYITRTPDSEDQRILRLRLTDKSREYLEHIRGNTEDRRTYFKRNEYRRKIIVSTSFDASTR